MLHLIHCKHDRPARLYNISMIAWYEYSYHRQQDLQFLFKLYTLMCQSYYIIICNT